MKRCLAYGWIILIFAILLNIIASFFKITTWYVYFEMIARRGFMDATFSLAWYELLFLYILYPGLLGLVVCIGGKLF